MRIDFKKNEDYPIQISDNIWLAGNYYLNSYIIKGSKESALVEMGVSATVDTVISQLEYLDITPSYLIITHPHTDHISGFEGLKERYPHSKVIAGSGAKKFVEHPKAASAMFYEDQFISNMLEKKGFKPGRSPIERIPDLAQCLAIDDIYEIDLGELKIKCINVKGHSPGSIVVHILELDTLLVSDSLGFHYSSGNSCPLFFTGYSEYIATIKYLEALNPKILGPAHQGPVFENEVEIFFRESYNSTEDLFNEITGKDHGGDIARDIFERFYVDEFKIYSEKNIMNGIKFLVKRAHESLK